MAKRLNPNLAKIHRNYLVVEVAELFGVHKNTVRAWVKSGLPICDENHPMIILGQELRDYLKAKNTGAKRPCKEDEMFCLKCRWPKKPAGGMVEYIPSNNVKGCLSAICPTCDSMMNRFSNVSKLEKMKRIWEVSIGGR
ncbi:MAG: hypothetical protein ACI9SP_002006 [Arenicella sp.]|jgi:hypothetical protein